MAGRTGCSVAARADLLTARAGHLQQNLRRVEYVLDHRASDHTLLAMGDRVAVVPLVVLAEIEDLVRPRARVRSKSRVLGPGLGFGLGLGLPRVERSGLGFGSGLVSEEQHRLAEYLKPPNPTPTALPLALAAHRLADLEAARKAVRQPSTLLLLPLGFLEASDRHDDEALSL